MFAQPVVELLRKSRRILLAGCGGGYDVFGAVPLLADLMGDGREVHLASLSFCYLNALEGARQHPELPNLYEVPAAAATPAAYCPEAWLARFLEERLGRRWSIWSFDKTGVRPLAAAYQHLVRALDLDCIVLVDGGIDSLCRGDETSIGTPAEDLVSLAAVQQVQVPTRVLGCVGLGAELRDGIPHEQVFQRIAELTRAGGYLGAGALLPQTAAGKLYADAVEYVFETQASQKRSHVHKVVLASMRGGFGADGPHVWVSPLLSQYWFFDLEVVARSHLFLSSLADTTTIWDATVQIEAARHEVTIRDRTRVPI
jgi:hypothetical protein